jgi:hypothetical protein
MARRGRRLTGGSVVKAAELLGWALGGLEKEIVATRERLAALTAQAAQLRGRVGRREVTTAGNGVSGVGTKRRRTRMTAAGRKRISEMMKKRWAEAKRKKQNRLS